MSLARQIAWFRLAILWVSACAGCHRAAAPSWHEQISNDLPAIYKLDSSGEDYANVYSKSKVLSREQAFDLLLKTREFSTGPKGYSGSMAKQVCAFQTILEQPDSVEAFVDLQWRSQVAGQLFALCGLYLKDRNRYDRLIHGYANDQREVTSYSGCIGRSRKASDLLTEVPERAKFMAASKP